VSKFTAFRM